MSRYFLTLMAMLLVCHASIVISGEPRDLTIAVTFPSLAFDVEKLVCEGDRVVAIIPGNVDPHHYELTPGDVEVVLRSDIIVSTGHTHFEEEIKGIVERNGGRTVLIEIPSLEPIKLRVIPGTSKVNLHGVIYDPDNYATFVEKLYETLVTLNPGKRGCYENRYMDVNREIDFIKNSSVKLNVKAVADSPLVQYAVEWLGIEIAGFVVKEHDLPPEPGSLMTIEELLRSKAVRLAVLTTPVTDKASEWLRDKALENEIPILYVPSPMSNGSVTDKLRTIINQINALQIGGTSSGLNETRAANNRPGLDGKLSLALLLVAATVPPTTWFIFRRKRVKP